ncbi:MAG: DEAD/DEAH box helicase family protein [Thaumarchaeota archaeon]|nr:DEAD/DEAH box helicase family protein [Nitrososphaerota archaeon]
MKFCPKCGSRLKLGRRGTSCPNCGSMGPSKVALADFFPFGAMRPFQREILDKLEAEIAARRKYIILEAPVGFGKSAVAAALCRYMGSAYILTSTKQLQDQYASDFGFRVVKGKSNFQCLVPTSSGLQVPCNKGRCEVDWRLSDCPHYLTFEQFDEHKKHRCDRESKCEHGNRLCPYYEQKWTAFRTAVAVCNYPFFLSELKYTDELPHRKLLVCDEVHDLEKQLVGFASFSLRRSTLESYGEGVPPEKTAIPDRGLEDPSAWLDTLKDKIGIFDDFCEAHLDDGDAQDRVASAKSSLESLEGFTESLKTNPENWVVNKVKKSPDGLVEEVVFQPINVGGYVGPLLSTADTVLMMSATVFSKDLLCTTVGLDPAEVSFIKVSESVFPVSNRPIYAMNVAQLNRANLEASLDGIARAVDEIMDRHSNERGVIHTTSYQQVNLIMSRVSEKNRARLITTDGGFERSVLLQIHGATGASVLISPSLFQGVDLKDELSRFQVVVKVPYPDLSERRTRVKLERDRGWYDWQTALRLVQTYGRSVRSETDHAVTYVLDSNFTRFVGEQKGMFPSYFLEAVKPGVEAK